MQKQARRIGADAIVLLEESGDEATAVVLYTASGPVVGSARGRKRKAALAIRFTEDISQSAIISSSGSTRDGEAPSREESAPATATAVINTPAVSTGVAYPGEGPGHWIRENIDHGRYLLLEDRSLWEVDPVGRIEASLWLPTESIVVVVAPTGVLPYRLVNTDSGEAVEARCIALR